jgi:DNA-binding NarL/FixJ family response regulator
MRTTVLVADDQRAVRFGLRRSLQRAPDLDVVGVAADGRQAVDMARRLRPDVVLVDVRMPGVDGIEATRELAAPALGHAARVLVITTFALDEYLAGALRAGAAGFILKDAPAETLHAAVRVVASGAVYVEPAMARRLAGALSAGLAPTSVGPLDDLSPRERQVLELLGAGLTNMQIAAQLVIAESTVKTHVHRVLGKLGVRTRTQAAVLARSQPSASSAPEP